MTSILPPSLYLTSILQADDKLWSLLPILNTHGDLGSMYTWHSYHCWQTQIEILIVFLESYASEEVVWMRMEESLIMPITDNELMELKVMISSFSIK